jgi:hypothetical protein
MLIFGDEVRLVTDSQRGGASVLIGTLDVIAHASGTFEFTRYPREFTVPWETRVCIGMRTNGEAWITYPDNTGTIGFGVDSGRDPCSSLTQLSPAEDLSIKADSQILARIEGSHPAHVKATWVITSNAIREVTASIYSVTGGLIRSFQPVLVSEGTTRITWDGRDAHGMRVASGSYFFVVEDASGYKAVQRTVLLR